MAPAKGKPRKSSKSLADAIVPRLRPASAAATKARLGEISAAATTAAGGKKLQALLAGKSTVGRFVAAVMECSPFLRSLILDDPARLFETLVADPAERARRLVATTAARWRNGGQAELMVSLRRARQEISLLVGLADLGGVWDVPTVTAALTDFADAAVGAAARFILAEAARAGSIDLPDPDDPGSGSGWVILGMGKFGGGELNYSSDIDLIVLYDPEVARIAPGEEPTVLFVRFTKRLVQILNEHTADGYVFRTDLRLRPDPGTTNIAMSTFAALQYYESMGQNWERAAMIKARPVAGDKPAGAAYLAALTPYIWRKYLDYAAIADIHSIKRQIHDFRGFEEVGVAGHNIKLGRGGIREIEFFVQTQQLIAGGRNPELRGRRTVEVLAALAKAAWIDASARQELTEAYFRLRTVEHCLQMVDDEQTHTLPEDAAALGVIARMAGFASPAVFSRSLLARLRKVRDHYTRLFESAPSLTSNLGSLVFTGDADDPDTLATLQRLGYANPSEVTRTVRGWHHGRYLATRSATARERLTEFVPALLEALATTDNADAAFAAFDRFLARLPAGVQLFALLNSNPGLLDLVATIMGVAPRLAETIIQRAHVLDAVVEPAFFGRLPERAVVEKRLAASLDEARSYEDALDRARVFGQEQTFLICLRVLAGTVGTRQAGVAFADLAEILVAALLGRVRREFEAAHGRIKGGRVAVVAFGKLGGREMTAASDLDLILLYDFDETATESDGGRPLSGGQYFARLTQRLVAALSVPTAEGTLYQVDFRLRPSGKSGPVATHIDAFAEYQARDAWTWEHMALTRARPIAGDESLMTRAGREIAAIIMLRRDGGRVTADILEMRAMVEAAKGGEGAWDLKQTPGGSVDIEFVAQYLQLLHAADHPPIVSTETETVLTAAAKANLLPAGEADILLPALRLYQSLTQILRLCLDAPFDPAKASRGLLNRLALAGEMPDFATLDRNVRDMQAAVRASFERLIGRVPPAIAAKRSQDD